MKRVNIFILDYKQIEDGKAFCSSNKIGEWSTEELNSTRYNLGQGPTNLTWYIGYGNGVCYIGNNGGVEACAKICRDTDGCQYFSVSTTRDCYACFIYKTCTNPISSSLDYKIYQMENSMYKNINCTNKEFYYTAIDSNFCIFFHYFYFRHLEFILIPYYCRWNHLPSRIYYDHTMLLYSSQRQ